MLGEDLTRASHYVQIFCEEIYYKLALLRKTNHSLSFSYLHGWIIGDIEVGHTYYKDSNV